MASGALFHARQHKADRIFCGHTHVAMHKERDGLHYYNAGGWIDRSPRSSPSTRRECRFMNTNRELTIVIPAKNEAELIRDC